MKRNKFRAVVTFDGAPPASQDADPLAAPQTLVVRACHHQTHQGRVFSAIIAPDDDCPQQPGDKSTIVNMTLLADDAQDYLAPGDRFDLWMGGVVGHGVVSRQMIPCW